MVTSAPAPISTEAILKQLNALLQVVSQVTQATMVDFFYAPNPAFSLRLPSFQQINQINIESLIQQVLAAGATILITDNAVVEAIVCTTTLEEPLGTSRPYPTYAGFPVKIRQHTVGVLSVLLSHSQTALSEEQKFAIATIANQIGYLLTGAARDAEFFTPHSSSPSHCQDSGITISQPSTLEIGKAAVMSLSMALQKCLSFDDLSNCLTEILPQHLAINAFQLLLLKEPQAYQEVCSWQAFKETSASQRGLAGQSSHDFERSSRPSNAAMVLPMSALELSSALCQSYSLQLKRRLVGVLKICPQAGVSCGLNRKGFEVILEQIGVTVYRLQLLQKLQAENLQDPLTQLFNRRHMMSVLSKLLKRVTYGRYQVGVILLDIDHFKRINDTYGHDAGDHVLRVVGLFLKGHTRPNDVVCRFGGEEFAILLPNITQSVLANRANRICRSIQHLSIKIGETPLLMTLSAGFAIAPNHGKTPATLIKAADQALYQAKRTGRNRALCALDKTIKKT